MAIDSPDSAHKHRRSHSDDEQQEHPKRHKHRRHHHRSHRRHSHHKSSRNTTSGGEKRDEETKADSETMIGELMAKVRVEEAKEIVPPAVLNKAKADYDMEEGEIVDDDAFSIGAAEIENKTIDSDVESGEITARTELENSDMKDAVAWGNEDKQNSKSLRKEVLESDSATNLTLDESDDKKIHSPMDTDDLLLTEKGEEDDIGRSRNADARSCRRSGSPLRGGDKRNCHSVEGSLKLMEVDEGEVVHGIDSFPYDAKGLKNRELSESPSDSRINGELRSKFVGGVSERSQSHMMHHVARSRSVHHDVYDILNGKINYDSDYERAAHVKKAYPHGSRDSVKDRDTDSSRHNRYTIHEDRHLRSEPRSGERDVEETIERYYRRDREETQKKVCMDHESEKNRHKEKEKEREKSRDRGHERSRELVRDREKAGERSRDVVEYREYDRDMEREKNRGRSKERDREREQRRDGSKAAYRDRYAERERERERDGDRARDRRLERTVDGRKERHEYKSRDVETERSSRYRKYDDYGGGFDDREKSRYSKDHSHTATADHRSRGREHRSEKDHNSKFMSSEDKQNRDDEDQEDYEGRVELKFGEQEEEDLYRIKEESRKRREAILQKYKNRQMKQQDMQDLDDTLKEDQLFQSPSMKDSPMHNLDTISDTQDADVADTSFSVGKSPPEIDVSAVERGSIAGGLGEGTPKSDRSPDMFCDDIFGDSPAGFRKSGNAGELRVERSGLHDNWDDPEGYYSYRFGEVLDGRYEITAAHGKGVFSTVVRAKDLRAGSGDPEQVAVKIIRNNETMLKAGMEELVILKKLVGADPDDRRHCVRFLSSFKYRNHLCLVFESLHMNLREVLKKFGRNIGLKLTAVRAYAKQLFIALKHLRNCGVLHCDIKPDNMLVNDAKNVLKLCDFGNAMFAGKNEITPYLVSRFYRAPEIILGLPYDHPVDIWSVGCCLYELYSGKVLFPGPTNNDMLRLHMELKGPFPKKILRKGAFIDQHFDHDLNFLATEEDPVTKKAVRRLMVNIKPQDIATIIKGSPGEDPKMLANFKDILDKIFMLDPDKRLTVSQALNHPFITGK
ncbi:hypothetical protein Dimus_031153 [Dionaea muscipula]